MMAVYQGGISIDPSCTPLCDSDKNDHDFFFFFLSFPGLKRRYEPFHTITQRYDTKLSAEGKNTSH